MPTPLVAGLSSGWQPRDRRCDASALGRGPASAHASRRQQREQGGQRRSGGEEEGTTRATAGWEGRAEEEERSERDLSQTPAPLPLVVSASPDVHCRLGRGSHCCSIRVVCAHRRAAETGEKCGDDAETMASALEQACSATPAQNCSPLSPPPCVQRAVQACLLPLTPLRLPTTVRRAHCRTNQRTAEHRAANRTQHSTALR